MAGTKEIRNKIKSVQNTRKITKAMEMVAASKMRKAQEHMRSARPYAEKVRNVAAHMAQANPEYRHPFMVKREVKRAGLIVVSTDKGLCGGLNTNMLRAVTNQLRELDGKGIRVQTTALGSKGAQFLSRISANLVSQALQMGDTPHLEKMIGAIKVQLDTFINGEVDVVYLAYTRFINTMRQEPVVEQLLPLDASRLEQTEAEKRAYSWDYIYEPDAQSVVDELLKRYVEALVYQSVAENMASEQSARMVAMKAASDNAKNVIGELQLVYNKTRQAAITKELSEIVSGAAAV
ncbi:MAG: F0F1 ATP synthase subunit gamma [Candidatus Protistobacter heckmanni]|nr:F0F1 ATP synthase subunit gamma [Candidatus Protistobacter heckmanni]